MEKSLDRRHFLSLLLSYIAGVGMLFVLGCRFLRKGKPKRRVEKPPRKVAVKSKRLSQVKKAALIPVAITQGDSPSLNVSKAISLVGGLSSTFKPGQTVVVKPNLTSPSRSGSGVVTDVQVTKEVISLLKQRGAEKVIIAEGPGGRGNIAMRAYEKAGYVQMAKELGTELVDLNSAPVREVSLPQGLAAKRYQLPEIILDADMFINIAVLKTHNLTKVTLSLKNLIGVPPTRIYGAPRNMFHKNIDQVIVDLNTIIKSHLVIIDGMVGMEGYGPIEGDPVRMNLVIASIDPVAADVVGTQVMGVDPQSIGHITLAAQKGLGTLDMAKIKIGGKQIAEVARKFTLP